MGARDIANERFGKWTALREGELKTSDGRSYWLCRCDCGSEREVSRRRLVRKQSRSCGKCRPIIGGKAHRDPNGPSGYKFGCWTVQWVKKGAPSQWVCQCSCGRRATFNSYYVRYRLVKSLVCRCYEHSPEAIRRSYLQGAYRTYVSQAARKGRAWNLSREQVMKLFESPCVYCSALPPVTLRWGGANVGRNGIDRIDSTRGYEPDNVVACCWTCNTAKNDQTLEEWNAWIDRLTQTRLTIGRTSAI